MERELALYLAIARRLPSVKGAGAVANALKKTYTRRARAEVEVDVLGARMALEPNEVVDRDLLFAPQLYDRPQMDHLRRWLRPGDTFLDIGANVGVYALVASRLVGPQGRVLAVEADPYNHRKLERNLRLSGASNVTALQLGVADRAEKLPFAAGVHGNRGGGSFAWADASILLECKPLKQIMDEQGITSGVRGMKMDIELFEHRVMKRFFAEAPRAQWPWFLFMERHWDPKFLEMAGGDIIALCEEQGYVTRWSKNGEFVLSLP